MRGSDSQSARVHTCVARTANQRECMPARHWSNWLANGRPRPARDGSRCACTIRKLHVDFERFTRVATHRLRTFRQSLKASVPTRAKSRAIRAEASQSQRKPVRAGQGLSGHEAPKLSQQASKIEVTGSQSPSQHEQSPEPEPQSISHPL